MFAIALDTGLPVSLAFLHNLAPLTVRFSTLKFHCYWIFQVSSMQMTILYSSVANLAKDHFDSYASVPVSLPNTFLYNNTCVLYREL